jgi:hypothetical protein
MSIQTTNPATNKVLKSFDEMTDELRLQSKSLIPSLKHGRKPLTTIGQRYCIK